MTATRRALHGVAELVLAGPQYRRTGEIALQVLPGGFGTTAEPELRIVGDRLVSASGRIPMRSTTIGDLASAAGVRAGAPADLYHGGSGAHPGDVIDISAEHAVPLYVCFELGDQALRRLAPDETPILWPEHFDLGISSEEVNYGVSPGDDFLDEPYAYVGPWQQRRGAFWTAPFGAAVPMRDLPDLDALLAFLTEGRERARQDLPVG